MRIALIAAIAKNGCIGKDGDLPWRLPADLKHFKQTTLGKPVIMGRKTWDSIGRPLPGRLNIIVTRQQDFSAQGATTVHSLQEALDTARATHPEEALIIGGAQLYAEALPLADTLYLTQVDATIEGDTFFPEFDRTAYQETARNHHPADDKNEYATDFITLNRPNS